MSADRTTAKSIIWKFPQTETTAVVIGDSQTKYLYHHFDPLCPGTPAFVSQPGACIADARSLIDFIPASATTVFLHVGTNDLSSTSAEHAFSDYRSLTDLILESRPNISTIHASLILPRSANRRRDYRISRFARSCNEKARRFNSLLREFCRHSRFVRFVDHGFENLPACRVLAADGLHPSFEGVALLAGHIRALCFMQQRCNPPGWRDFACTANPVAAPAILLNDRDFPPLPPIPSSVRTPEHSRASSRPPPPPRSTATTAPRVNASTPSPTSTSEPRASGMPPPTAKPAAATTPRGNERGDTTKIPDQRRTDSLPSPTSASSTTAEPTETNSSVSAGFSGVQNPAPRAACPYNLRKNRHSSN